MDTSNLGLASPIVITNGLVMISHTKPWTKGQYFHSHQKKRDNIFNNEMNQKKHLENDKWEK